MVGISRVMYLPSSGTQKIMKPPSEREFISLREGVSVHQDAAQFCGCRKRQHKCTAGCECTHCKNVLDSCDSVIEIVCTNEEECEEEDEEFEKDEEYEEQDEECEEKDDDDCEELENIMEFVFG